MRDRRLGQGRGRMRTGRMRAGVMDNTTDEQHVWKVDAWWEEQAYQHARHMLALVLLAPKLVACEQQHAEEQWQAIVIYVEV